MSHDFTTPNLLEHDDNHSSSQWLLESGPVLKSLHSATNAPNQQFVPKKLQKWECWSMYLFLTIIISMPAGCWSWRSGFTPKYISTLCPELGLCSGPDGSVHSVGVYNSRVLVRRYWAPQARIMVSGLETTSDFLDSYYTQGGAQFHLQIVSKCTIHPGFKWSHPM